MVERKDKLERQGQVSNGRRIDVRCDGDKQRGDKFVNIFREGVVET